MANLKRNALLGNNGIWTELAREIAPHVERALDRACAELANSAQITREEAHAYLIHRLRCITAPYDEEEAEER